MGAAAGERWVAKLSRGWRWAIEGALFASIGLAALYIAAIILPLAPSGPLKEFALKNNGDLREEIGWDDLVREVASVRDALPAERRASMGVLVGNYGEMGALEIMGPAYGLPAPISLTNSGWLRSFPEHPPQTLIVVGWSLHEVDGALTNCRLAGHNGNSLGIENEESRDHAEIFVCGGPRKGWKQFWDDEQRFG
jgi:hypothetical protein